MAGWELEPRDAGAVTLAGGRTLGYSEYGDPGGRAIIWFHGTPGGSRQIPLDARAIAARLGVRLVLVERPGIGRSSPHLHPSIAGFADDIAELADALGIDGFAVAGLSGGGPYALACAARLAPRVAAAAVLGGVAPAIGEDAAAGGLVGFAARVAPLLEVVRVPAGHAMWGIVRAIQPFGPLAIRLYAQLAPEGDRRVFERPEIRAMFLDDITHAAARQFHAVPSDLVLFTRDWGFALRDVKVPVRLWHGDSDNIVPLAHAQHMAALIPDAVLTVRSGESHLGGLDAADDVLSTLLALWERHE
jgi:pimeloyl-ACP methyl ester carboxylesterase